MTQRDRGLVPDVLVEKFRNESKNLGRDAADWCEVVPPRSVQAEDLERVLLKSADLT